MHSPMRGPYGRMQQRQAFTRVHETTSVLVVNEAGSVLLALAKRTPFHASGAHELGANCKGAV